MASLRTGNRRPVIASVEMLEERRLLSADVTAVFGASIPSHLMPGGQTRIVMGLLNQGDASAAGRATVRLYASLDPALEGSDTLLASGSRTIKLKQGGRTNLTLPFAAPATLAGGDYYLLAQVDAAGVGAEKAAGRVTISPRIVHIDAANVDLTGTFSSIPTRPVALGDAAAGRNKSTVRVKNVGNTLANGKASVSFYLSADATLDAGDPLLAVTTRSLHLKAGQSTTFSASVAPLPPGTAVGGYFLFAVVTPGTGISEMNTANNTARSAQRVAVVASFPTTDHHHHHHDGSGGVSGDTTTVVIDEGGSSDVAPDDTSADNSSPPDTGPATAPADSSPPPDTAPADSNPPPDTTPADNGPTSTPASDSSGSADSSSSGGDTSFDSSGGDF